MMIQARKSMDAAWRDSALGAAGSRLILQTQFSLRTRFGLLALWAATGLLAGCGLSDPIEFQPNRLQLVDRELTAAQEKEIDQTLASLFGTPDAPLAPAICELDLAKLRRASGPAGYEQKGGKRLQRGLYRQHCAQCHGITGDGYGPAADMVVPYPRDFRQAVFKFKSTYRDARPTDDDLRRMMVDGMPGTSMPSFRLLSEEQQWAIVEYIKYLSMRGEVEQKLIDLLSQPSKNLSQPSENEFSPLANEFSLSAIDAIVAQVAQRWLEADQQVVQPDRNLTQAASRDAADIAASAQRGKQLFLSTRAKCADCHGTAGNGKADSGDVAPEYDDWLRENVDFRQTTATLADKVALQQAQLKELTGSQRERATERLERLAEQLQAREQVVKMLLKPLRSKPRDLTKKSYHGGKKPLDLFRRIHQGVPGTPMPLHSSPRPGVEGTLTEKEIWEIVDYLQSGINADEPE